MRCNNCGDALGDVQHAGQVDYALCLSCGTLHRVDPVGAPGIPPPVRLPRSVAVSRSRDGMAIVIRDSRKGVTIGLVISGVLAVLAVLSAIAAPDQWSETMQIYSRWLVAPVLAVTALGLFVLSIPLLTTVQTFLIDGFGVCLCQPSCFRMRFRSLWAQDVRLVAPVRRKVGVRAYAVRVHTSDDTANLMIGELDEPEQALFLAYQLENWLVRNKAAASDHSEARKHALAKMEALKQGKVGLLQHTLVETPARREPPKAGVELACGRCGAPVSEIAMHRPQNAAICGYCGNVFDLPDGPTATYQPEYASPYSFSASEGALELTRSAWRKDDAYPLGQPWATGVVIMFLMTAVLYLFKAAGKDVGVYVYLLIFLVLALPQLVLLVYDLSLTLRRRAQRVQVDRTGVLIEDSSLRWYAPMKVYAANIESIFAYTNKADPELGARLLIETTDGEILTSFELPSPWHALHLARETRRLVKA
ncbi:MAG: hypothetical protein H6839_13390 [Planctomycetes bacterium]|nr:hypothetical protein [Planctomycetota bacterium]